MSTIYTQAQQQSLIFGHPDHVSFVQICKIVRVQTSWEKLHSSSSGDICKWVSDKGLVVALNLRGHGLFVHSRSGKQIYIGLGDVGKFLFRELIVPKISN
jgi:hypothetical protein